ncbi:MAG TPA: DUF4126 domain-containing protein [Candidatus Aquilonibacter sp.]
MDPRDVALAYSLSSIAGLRASLTIFAIALAVHGHLFTPPDSLAWLASENTLWIAGALTVADFIGDKIPLVDHALQAVHTVLAPAAGGIAAASLDPSGGTSAGVVGLLGATNALGIHGIKSVTRVGTSAVSGGLLSPIVSVVEDAIAVVALAIAFIAPFLVAILAVIATIFAATTGRRLVAWIRRKRSRSSA